MSIIYSELNDSRLVRLASKQDELAFTELLVRHKDYIFNVCIKFSNNEHDAKDVSQKALLKAWKALPRFRSDCLFKTWIYKIIRNLVYDHSSWRKRRAEVSLEIAFFGAQPNKKCFLPLTEDGASKAFEVVRQEIVEPDRVIQKAEDLKDLRSRLDNSLKMLKPEHRECLKCLSEGMTYEEISKVQKVPLGTVMSRVFYARKMARRYCSKLRDFKV